MLTQERTILLVSDDAALCATARREFEGWDHGLRVAAVSTIDAARRVVQNAAPAVILLEETSMSGTQPFGQKPRLDVVVSGLAMHAPVVVIGRADQEKEMYALVQAGAADFVPRAEECLSVAMGFVERRLRQTRRVEEGVLQCLPQDSAGREAFGEVLRHELNNPLTGILGNAELLLAEVRRKNDGRLPNGGQQRLETIAALAVRLRETVRRLSQEWDTEHRTASSGT